MKLIKQNDVLQAHPEFLNEQIDDHDKAIYAKGWNDCNKEYYNAITELPVASMACTDLSTRLRRAFEADELVNQRLLLDAADAIEELLAGLERYRHAAFVISETCVEESKCHISPEEAIKKIRGQLYYGGHRCELPPHGDLIDLSAKVDCQYYDEMYEEWSVRTVTVEDVLLGCLEKMPPVIVPASEEVE